MAVADWLKNAAPRVSDGIPHHNAINTADGDSAARNVKSLQGTAQAKPGYLTGLNEKANVNSMMGSVRISVPIEIPSGRHGFTPQLQLLYDSNGGNGPFGLGWSLQAPRISRKVSCRLPQFDKEKDSFLLTHDGQTEELVRMSTEVRGKFVVTSYFPQVIRTWIRIELWEKPGQPGCEHWKAVSGDNIVSLFGKDPASRIEASQRSKTSAWLLSERYDCLGNTEMYSYKQEDTVNIDQAVYEQNRRHNINRYLESVRYGNKTPNRDLNTWEPLTSDEVEYCFNVFFDYTQEDPAVTAALLQQGQSPNTKWKGRSDPVSNYKSTTEVRTHRLCRNILVLHNFAELEDSPTLVRSYTFQYDESPSGSRLASVYTSAYNSLTRKDRLPIHFKYHVPPPLESLAVNKTAVSLSGASELTWLSINGNGVPDIVARIGDRWHRRRNLSPLALHPSFSNWEAIKDVEPGSHFELDDFDKDGIVEMVDLHHGFHRRTDRSSWSDFKAFDALPTLNFKANGNKSVDLTGDGKLDLLVDEGDRFLWFEALGDDGFTGPFPVNLSGVFESHDRPRLISSNHAQHILLADMTGDGLLDIVRIQNGSISYWPNLGFGYFGKVIAMSNSPCFDSWEDFSSERFIFADVDGSGTADILYIAGEGSIHVYNNQCGNSWSEPRTIKGISTMHVKKSGFKVIDMFGTGTMCLVYADEHENLAYVDLMGGCKPNLLLEMENGMGAKYIFSYRSSTHFELLDAHNTTRPSWKSKIPFPVPCLYREEFFDQNRQYREVNEYRYHGGSFDFVEKEFTGFNMVELWEGSRTAGSSGVHTKTWFHTGCQRLELLRETHRGSTSLDTFVLCPETHSSNDNRDMLRALKGCELRKETFSACQELISVDEHCFQIYRRKTGATRSVWQSTLRETRSHVFEADKSCCRKSQYLAQLVDDFGNVVKTVEIHYGNESSKFQQQKESVIRVVERDMSKGLFFNDHYRVPIEVGERTYEGTARLVEAFVTGVDCDTFSLKLSSSSQTTFRSDDLSHDLPLGETGALARIAARSGLVFTSDMLSVYDGKVSVEDLLAAGYSPSNVNGATQWCSESQRLHYSVSVVSAKEELLNARTSFYSPVRLVDTRGRSHVTVYDKYYLMEERRVNPLSHSTALRSDYRLLQFYSQCNAGGVIDSFTYDPFGHKERFSQSLKDEEQSNAPVFETLNDDLLSRLPSVSRKLLGHSKRLTLIDLMVLPVRELHIQRRATEDQSTDDMPHIEIHYLDGRGRTMQTKTYAGTRGWLTTGWTDLDERGFSQSSYEPYFADDLGFSVRREGFPTVSCHDPLGRVIRTLKPDGAWTKTNFNAWSEAHYDEGDTSAMHADEDYILPRIIQELGTLPSQTWGVSPSADTPRITHLDPCGRPFREAHLLQDKELCSVTRKFTPGGLLLSLTDSMNRVVASYTYDMIGNHMYSNHMDSGPEILFYTVDGQTTHIWRGTSAVLQQHVYDKLNRRTASSIGDVAVIQYTFENSPLTGYDFGHVKEVRDQCGLLLLQDYDVHGKPCQMLRYFGKETQGTYDWRFNVALEESPFTVKERRDGMGSIVERSLPGGNTETSNYCELHRLQRIAGFVENVQYNALGLTENITFANGARLRKEYDHTTWRTKKQILTDSTGHLLQQLDYCYDANGNIEQIIRERGQESEPTIVNKYDPLNRITSSSYRDHRSQELLELEEWQYDSESNILYHKGAHGTKSLEYESRGDEVPRSNRLLYVGGPSKQWKISYSGVAGLRGLPTDYRDFELGWNDFGQLENVTRMRDQERWTYRYDYTGQRCRRIQHPLPGNSASPKDTIYLESYTATRTFDSDDTFNVKQSSLEVKVHGNFLVKTQDHTAKDQTSTVTTIVTDHLGSPSVFLNGQSRVISTAAFSVYGTAKSFSAVGRCRGFTGHPLDPETGFYYAHHRFYDPAFARWVSPDPAGYVDGTNRYCYVRSNPMNYVDPNGLVLTLWQKVRNTLFDPNKKLPNSDFTRKDMWALQDRSADSTNRAVRESKAAQGMTSNYVSNMVDRAKIEGFDRLFKGMKDYPQAVKTIIPAVDKKIGGDVLKDSYGKLTKSTQSGMRDTLVGQSIDPKFQQGFDKEKSTFGKMYHFYQNGGGMPKNRTEAFGDRLRTTGLGSVNNC